MLTKNKSFDVFLMNCNPNNDSVISSLDLSMIIPLMGTMNVTDDLADINGDSIISSLDLAAVIPHMGKVALIETSGASDSDILSIDDDGWNTGGGWN